MTSINRDEYRQRAAAAERAIRFKRRGEPGQWNAYVGNRLIAEIDKTGTHLDYFPWQIILHFAVEQDERGRERVSTSTSEDTMRACRQKVIDAWAYRVEGEA